MSSSDQVQSDMVAVSWTLFKDGDDYCVQSLDGKVLSKPAYKVDVAPQCRFVTRQESEMPFFFRVHYGEDYEQADLEKHCRSHGLTEISPKTYIQHCRDAHPCAIMRFIFPPGGSSEELFSTFPDSLKTQYLAHHPVDDEPSQCDFWFDNMGPLIFFEGEKAIPTTDDRMETMVDAYFVLRLRDDIAEDNVLAPKL